MYVDFFDDLYLEEVAKSNSKESGLTENQLRAINRLKLALEKYLEAFPNDGPREKIINTLEWDEVTQAARELVAVSKKE